MDIAHADDTVDITFCTVNGEFIDRAIARTIANRNRRMQSRRKQSEERESDEKEDLFSDSKLTAGDTPEEPAASSSETSDCDDFGDSEGKHAQVFMFCFLYLIWFYRFYGKSRFLLKFLKNAHFRTKNNHFFTPKTVKKLFMTNRTLGNDIFHGKIHQNEVLWLFREEKLTILLNFLKNGNFLLK